MRLWPREPLIGPLGAWELTRLARRGHGHRTRVLVLYLLLLAFVMTVAMWFERTDLQVLFSLGDRHLLFGPEHAGAITAMAAFGSRFALSLLESVLLAVAAMTPAYAAAALAEDKERRALDLLLTTPLSDREIVFGKAAGRLGFVLAAAAASLPILAATTLFGGVDLWLMVSGSAVVVSTATLMTAIGIRSSIVMPDLRSALLHAYVIAALCTIVFPVISVITLIPWAVDPAGWKDQTLPCAVLVYSAAAIVMSASMLRDSTKRLRHGGVSRAALPDEKPGGLLMPTETELQRAEPANLYLPDLPPVDDENPVRWRERHVIGRRARIEQALQPSARTAALYLLGTLALMLVFVGGCQRVYVAITTPPPQPDPARDAYLRDHPFGAPFYGEPEWKETISGDLLLHGGSVALGLYLVPMTIALSAIVARERRQSTLEPLLALPIPRREILMAKVGVVMRRSWGWAALAAASIGLAFGAEYGGQYGAAAAGTVFGGVALIAGLGTWLSVRCLTELRALRLLIPAMVVAFGAPIAAWHWKAGFPWHFPLLGLAGAAALGSALGLGAWVIAVRRFERIGG